MARGIHAPAVAACALNGGTDSQVHPRLDAVNKAAEGFQADVTAIPGRGEFLGTKLDTGSDREQRDDARRVYEQTIKEIAASGELENLPRTWDEVRDHWKSISEAKALETRAGHDVSDEPRDEQGRWTDGGGGNTGAWCAARARSLSAAGGDLQPHVRYGQSADFNAELDGLREQVAKQQKIISRLRAEQSQLAYAQQQNSKEITLTGFRMTAAIGEQTRAVLQRLQENGFDLVEEMPPLSGLAS
jgi:hypothetical protein